MRFPESFVWGAASSAIQTEGYPQADGGGVSVWDSFSAEPGRVSGNETPEIACDGYHRYEEDIALLERMKLRAYRFSLSWARIDPLGDGEWNSAGIDYYDRVVDCCIKHGVEPYVTMHHWELPQALEDRGGWQSRETAEAFARFAGMMAERFKGRVRYYFTINEPQCIVQLGYDFGVHAPGKKLPLEGRFQCWKNLMLAHGLAGRAVKAADAGALVGIASTGRLCYPERDCAEDMAASREASFRLLDDDWEFTHSMALDPVCFGRLPTEPGSELQRLAAAVTEEEWSTIHFPPDYIGVNVYNGWAVKLGENGEAEYVRRCEGFPRTALKWPVTERVMNGGIVHLYERYGMPIYITENGQSCNDRVFLDGKVHDPDRIDFLRRYLMQLSLAMERADVRGYFHWSLTDNFEWNNGYGERFGLIYISYPDGRRILKDSACWYMELAASGGETL